MTHTISAKKRTKGEGDALRAEGKIPAVVYGPEIEPIVISVDAREFEKLYSEAGESSLVQCEVEGEKEPITVLIQDLQNDPLKDRVLHVDFRQIKMGEEMTATIELNFVGEPDAVKSLGGTLNTGYDSVNVKCLPKDLVSSIDVDLSALETFENSIHVKDLVLPAGITVTDAPDALVAKVAAPLTEEQLAAMEETTDTGVDSVEVEGEKVEEGEEGAEGEKAEAKPEEKKEEEKKEEEKK